jgi:hypothetical protein
VDIKGYKFFAGFKFDELIALELTLPIQPEVSGEADTSNFDPYPESENEASDFTGTPDPFDSFNAIV